MILARLFMISVVAGISTFGCDEDGSLFSGDARLHFHNQLTKLSGGSSSDVKVNLFVDDQNSPLLSGKGYTTTDNVSSQTVSLDDESENIAFDVTGTGGSTLIGGPVQKTLNENGRYTVVMMGDTTLDDRRLGVFGHQRMDVGSNQIRVRFINTLSRLNGDLQVSLAASGPAGPGGNSGGGLADQLSYGESSGYKSLATTSNLEVTVSNQTQGVVLDNISCNVSGGRVYDAIIAYRRFDSDNDQVALYCQPFNN